MRLCTSGRGGPSRPRTEALPSMSCPSRQARSEPLTQDPGNHRCVASGGRIETFIEGSEWPHDTGPWTESTGRFGPTGP